MWKLIGEILTSKKAIATMAGVLIVASNRIGLQLPEEAITQIIGAIAAYVVSQGLADFGKAAKQLPFQVVAFIATSSFAMVA
jgi:ABC-type Co2+ transport system permease subunit